MRPCVHKSAHEVVRSLRMAWAEQMIETWKSAMTLVCCIARLFHLSSGITCDICYGVTNFVHHTVEQSYRRPAAVHYTKLWNDWLHAL